MKKLITIAAVMIIMLTGCGKSIQVETPPWSDKQVEQMEHDNVKTISFTNIRF